MVTDQLDDWTTQAEAAEILKCSQKNGGSDGRAEEDSARTASRSRTKANAGFQSRRHRGDPR